MCSYYLQGIFDVSCYQILKQVDLILTFFVEMHSSLHVVTSLKNHHSDTRTKLKERRENKNKMFGLKNFDKLASKNKFVINIIILFPKKWFGIQESNWQELNYRKWNLKRFGILLLRNRQTSVKYECPLSETKNCLLLVQDYWSIILTTFDVKRPCVRKSGKWNLANLSIYGSLKLLLNAFSKI